MKVMIPDLASTRPPLIFWALAPATLSWQMTRRCPRQRATCAGDDARRKTDRRRRETGINSSEDLGISATAPLKEEVCDECSVWRSREHAPGGRHGRACARLLQRGLRPDDREEMD